MVNLKPELPCNLYTASGVRELDRIAIQEKNIAGQELMERAGQAAFDLLRARWPGAGRLAVVCGLGNNGGDGYVVARLAREAGIDVSVLQHGDASNLRGDALGAAERCIAANVRSRPYDKSIIEKADVVVDALLGTGLDRVLDSEWQNLIDEINRHSAAILSVDIPSGLHADTGRCMDTAIRADATITFIGMKQGLVTADGPGHCGDIYFADLAVPQEIYQQVPVSSTRIDMTSLASLLPPRARDTHKGQCGHVLVVGGDYGYAGAVRMAGEAAMRSGAGLVTIATRPEHALAIPLARPELMTRALDSSKDLMSALEKASAVVIGPGLGQSEWAVDLLSQVLQGNLPLVVDADALNLLALEPCESGRWILTPHPGEAARLLNCSPAEVQSDRFSAARALQEKYGGVSILKGCGSLVVDADASISVCDAGNPGMASGGMGDVLSGVIAGLLAQGLGFGNAARLAVCLHSSAADAAATKGERGLLATDLMMEIRSLANPGTRPGP